MIAVTHVLAKILNGPMHGHVNYLFYLYKVWNQIYVSNTLGEN